MASKTQLQKLRLDYQPILPKVLQNISKARLIPAKSASKSGQNLKNLFPHLSQQPQSFLLKMEKKASKHAPKRVGVVLSGGQAPGGHNVIAGLFDALKELNPKSKLFGFLDGPKGIIEGKSIEITEKLLASYRNQGGFDMIGSGRTKIETPEQFASATKTVSNLKLDGLVIIGGDDSNTNAALLAEYFLDHACDATVVGVPKTIDGDLKNDQIEISFGFDTASKTYSEIIGNILRDTLSAKKYYYFIKLMGRSASHITLECALQTHPNLALIGEEVADQKKTLKQVTEEIVDLIVRRAEKGKDYGVILIPEGIIEFIPEFKQLIKELNSLLAGANAGSKESQLSLVKKKLSKDSLNCFEQLPSEIQLQLLLDRDPHGNVQVSKIETERMFIEMVKKALDERKKGKKYGGKFSGQPHFCGYEGRSCFPSNFDSQYCYALGYAAALLIENGLTGYMAAVQNLRKPVELWRVAAINLVTMMHLEERHGKTKPVIAKALVDLKDQPFKFFAKARSKWVLEDDYQYPGPIQFFGPKEVTEAITSTLALESAK